MENNQKENRFILKNGKTITIRFSKIPKSKLKEVLDFCKGKDELCIEIRPEDLKVIGNQGIVFNRKDYNTCFYSQTIKEAPPIVLSKLGIRDVLIGLEENPASEKIEILKYIIIYSKLRLLIKDIDMKLPEKDKFKTVYTRLAYMIDYDKGLLDENSKYSEENARTSRNLENAVLLNTSICLGFADTLKQMLSLVGIEAKIIPSLADTNGLNHAFNVIKIDGKWYNADLTWDYPYIRRKIRPPYCLKSDKEFQRCEKEEWYSHQPDSDSIEVPKCNESLEVFPELKSSKTIIKRVKQFIKDQGERAIKIQSQEQSFKDKIRNWKRTEIQEAIIRETKKKKEIEREEDISK